MEDLLKIRNLKLYYRTRRGIVRAVDNVNFDLHRGETLAIVGESGCGKSSTAIAIVRILPRNIDTYEGEIILDGVDIMKMDDERFREEVAWRRISMVFQGAMNALNPVIKIGFQVAEPLIVHGKLSRGEAFDKARELLSLVGLPSFLAERYPHELSGGMKQRVIIAMALALNPEVVILDEPTSALDVITQANIMNLLKRLKREEGLSYIFITHDLALASELADTIIVMYGGKIVEYGTAEQVYLDPKHPYSQKLLASIPTLRTDKKLEFIPCAPPFLVAPPPGCRFHPRCLYAMPVCREKEPIIREIEKDRYVACWLYGG
ncbi:MAG: ABC transporter ATP-binding protein [Candidatus Bathyarchaeota archaeon]|nr:ABC transporter ATP-binding protein [Candidatus Bathyarchaeota archaeon]